MTDNQTNNVIGWSIVAVCVMVYPFIGFWGLFSFFLLFGLCMAWLGLKNHNDFMRREERAEANHRRRQAEIRAQLNHTRAAPDGVNRSQPTPVLWGNN